MFTEMATMNHILSAGAVVLKQFAKRPLLFWLRNERLFTGSAATYSTSPYVNDCVWPTHLLLLVNLLHCAPSACYNVYKTVYTHSRAESEAPEQWWASLIQAVKEALGVCSYSAQLEGMKGGTNALERDHGLMSIWDKNTMALVVFWLSRTVVYVHVEQ